MEYLIILIYVIVRNLPTNYIHICVLRMVVFINFCFSINDFPWAKNDQTRYNVLQVVFFHGCVNDDLLQRKKHTGFYFSLYIMCA